MCKPGSKGVLPNRCLPHDVCICSFAYFLRIFKLFCSKLSLEVSEGSYSIPVWCKKIRYSVERGYARILICLPSDNIGASAGR